MTPAQIKAKELINALLPKPIHEWRDIVAAALEASEAARVKAEQECAQIGSDAEAQSYLDADGVPVEKARLRSEWVGQRDRITALEAERDALKEAGCGLDALLAEIETVIKTVSSRQSAYQAIVDGRSVWCRALESSK